MNDPNFMEAIEILESSKIPYWLCHGTLLGIIRDKNLIPWDDDIDIAIFKSEVNKKNIKKIFQSKGFKNTNVNISGSIHFKKNGGRNVDINFYEKINKEEHAVLWKLPKKNIFFRVLHIIVNDTEYNGNYIRLIKTLSKFKIFFKFIIYILDIWKLTYITKGYTLPSKYLENFIHIKVDKIKLRVPEEYASVCSYTYGDTWKKPIENFNWEVDSPSTKNF
tara:strand:+ start:734 stop:1393 length:660 start_codon:yes stop_codon:yes gene_type:complete